MTVAIGASEVREELEGARQLVLRGAVGRIEEHQVERAVADMEIREGRGPVHADRGIPTQRFAHSRRVPFDDGCRARRLLDEIRTRRTSADRLESQRARSRVQIEHRGAAEGIRRFEGAEERLAHAVAGGPCTGVRDLEREGAGAPRDDACHTPTIAGGLRRRRRRDPPRAGEAPCGAPDGGPTCRRRTRG